MINPTANGDACIERVRARGLTSGVWNRLIGPALRKTQCGCRSFTNGALSQHSLQCWMSLQSKATSETQYLTQGGTQTKLPHSGFDPFKHVRFPNCRDTRYLGAAIVVGKGLNARAHMNANAGNQETPDSFVWKPDPEKKAKEFGVDMVVANTGRIWTFDHGECQYGYGWASIIRDDLHCTYQAMGYDSDTSANSIP